MQKQRVIVALAVVALVLTACNAGACSRSKLADFRDELDLLLEEWDDANEVANSTARISLSPAIGELQSIRREVSNLEVPPCEEAEAVQEAAVDYMEARIDLYMAFMTEASEDEMDRHQYLSSQEFDSFMDAVQGLNERIGD